MAKRFVASVRRLLTANWLSPTASLKDYAGPLTKSDAQRVVDFLIAADNGKYTSPNASATLADVGREYLALSKPNWGSHMLRSAGNLIEKHIIGSKLSERPIADLTEATLQAWVNEYINAGASRSLLKGLLLNIRAIFKHARKSKIMTENRTEDLRARSKIRPSERYLSVDECRRLIAVDRLIVRILIQLGLRPEELFALRRDDIMNDQLRIDEALVEGKIAPVKTEASDAHVYLPDELRSQLRSWTDAHPGDLRDWLFQPAHGRRGHMNQALPEADPDDRAGCGRSTRKGPRFYPLLANLRQQLESCPLN
jgi:integrase